MWQFDAPPPYSGVFERRINAIVRFVVRYAHYDAETDTWAEPRETVAAAARAKRLCSVPVKVHPWRYLE